MNNLIKKWVKDLDRTSPIEDVNVTSKHMKR